MDLQTTQGGVTPKTMCIEIKVAQKSNFDTYSHTKQISPFTWEAPANTCLPFFSDKAGNKGINETTAKPSEGPKLVFICLASCGLAWSTSAQWSLRINRAQELASD